MTLGNRVMAYIGTVSDTASLTDWLTSSARKIVDILPLSKADKYTVSLTDAGSGVNVQSARIVKANKSGYEARQVDSGLKAQVADTDSIYYAIATDPVFYIDSGIGYVKPSGGSIIALNYPVVNYADEFIGNFPQELNNAVILDASVKGAIQKSSTAITTLVGLTFDTATAPTTPQYPAFAYVNANIGTYTQTTVADIGTAPTYIPPTWQGVFTDFDTAMTDKDIELAQEFGDKLKTQLSQWQNDISNSVAIYKKDADNYQVKLQTAIQNAQLAQQEILAFAKDTTDLNLQNAAQTLASQLKQYESTLSKYGADLQVYSAKIGENTQKFSGTISQAVQELSGYLSLVKTLREEYATDLQSFLGVK